MELIGILAVVIALIVLGVMIQADMDKKKRAKLEAVIDSQEGFTATHKHIGADYLTGIAIDDSRRKVCLLRAPASVRIYSFDDILSCEVFEDGESLTKTVRSSQALGAVVGSLAFGGVGAIVGGLSGSKKTVDKVSRIDLRVVVNDMQAPIHDVSFLNAETKKGGEVHKLVSQQARFWAGLFDVIIKNSRSQKEVPVPGGTRSAGVAEQIRELAKLRDEGILTEEEFAAQKAKILV